MQQKEKKIRQLHVRLTEEEWILINELAERAGMTVSAFVIRAIFDTQIRVNVLDTQAIIRPLLGLQRHYNTIRYWMLQNNKQSPILSDEHRQEIENLWQLLAQAKDPVAQQDL